jgi:DNA-binding LacI/PurR family transcriptional regulator
MARLSKFNIVSVADEAKVSIATVSRVVNNHQGVSEPLRMRIKKILDKRGYRPSVVANRRTNIAIITEMGTAVIENYLCQILSGIADYGLEQGIETSIAFVRPSDAPKYDLIKTLRERRCDGAVIVFASDFSDEQISELSKGGLPTMLVSSTREIEDIGFIDIDSYAGGIMATEYLLSLGHSRIAFLAGPTFRNIDNQKRIEGFKKAISVSGLPEPPLIIEHRSTSLTQEAGYFQAQIALRSPDITAIFANNDEMAHGAMLACVESGRKIPDDISMIGFDDCPNSQYSIPPLTTVKQPLINMGYEAIKMVDMKVRSVIDSLPRKILQGALVKRKSTCQPKNIKGKSK